MRVSLDLFRWKRAIDALGSKNAIKAGIRAVNRTATNSRAAMVPVIAADMALPAKTVRDRITIDVAKATGQAPRAYLYADARRVPLINFNAKGPEPSRGKGRGVRAKLPSGAGVYPRAFIATMKSGHRGVYERKPGAKRLGIYELRGPSIAQSFNTNSAVAEDRASEMLIKNFEHEVGYLLEQAKQ